MEMVMVMVMEMVMVMVIVMVMVMVMVMMVTATMRKMMTAFQIMAFKNALTPKDAKSEFQNNYRQIFPR